MSLFETAEPQVGWVDAKLLNRLDDPNRTLRRVVLTWKQKISTGKNSAVAERIEFTVWVDTEDDDSVETLEQRAIDRAKEIVRAIK